MKFVEFFTHRLPPIRIPRQKAETALPAPRRKTKFYELAYISGVL